MGKSRDDGGADGDLWRRVAATVKPYAAARKPGAAGLKIKSAGEKSTETRPQKKSFVPPAAPPPAAAKGRGFDAATERRMRRGQLWIEGRLDLHGLSQAGARDALARFIASALRQGWRTVLVVTGKSGVLRRLAPQWLEEMPGAVLACTPARPKDGGEGALYVRLRRGRD